MTWTRVRARAGVAAAGVLLVLPASGCTGEEDPVQPSPPSPPRPVETTSPSSAATLTVAAGPMLVRLGPVRGQLHPAARAQLQPRLRRVLGTWMSTAFVGGDFPRTNYADAFSTYTPGAAAQARQQRAVTTTAQLGAELVEVVPTLRAARVAVLAVRGRAVGVSARVFLVVVGARQDGTQLELVVQGRLRLTPTPDGWRIFGFDLSRSVGAPGTFAAQQRRARQRDGRGRDR